MKIYILRHEERYEPPTFYTTLTPCGYKNADNLKHILSSLNISKIFSSPFLRTIQTIIPYCLQNNLKSQICVEYSLYETMYDKCFTKENYKVRLTAHDKEFKYTDPEYSSLIDINDINCPETKSNVKLRITNFINNLISSYKQSDECILIVAHGAVFEPLVPKSNTIYPLGGITKIYDNCQVCIPINY
jgi:2,3-bisphosphoglycerate-dependent phosphoglycerate mutase